MSQSEINGHLNNYSLPGSGQDLAAPEGTPVDPRTDCGSPVQSAQGLGGRRQRHGHPPGPAAEWVRPIVEIGVLPVHAAISESASGGWTDRVVVVGNKAYVTNQTANTLSIVTLNTTDARAACDV